MNLWRLHVRPSAEEGIDPVAVCLRKGLLGIGWGVDKPPQNKDDYWKAGLKKYGNKGWKAAANAMLYRMEIDDLVWFGTLTGIYYIGRITSDWRYTTDSQCICADLSNVRKAEIYEAGTYVAGKIINCFRPSATIQAIDNETALAYSKLLFNHLSDRTQYAISVTRQDIDIFDLLSDVELEDVVGLYLQIICGYALVPSSRQIKDDTLFYEYELLSRDDGSPAYVQVRGGNVKINLSDYGQFGRKIFLFSPAGYQGKKPQNAYPISRDDIQDFLDNNAATLPDALKIWIDYCKRVS